MFGFEDEEPYYNNNNVDFICLVMRATEYKVITRISTLSCTLYSCTPIIHCHNFAQVYAFMILQIFHSLQKFRHIADCSLLESLKSAVEFGKPWLYISSASLFHVRLEPMSKFAILDAFSAKLLAQLLSATEKVFQLQVFQCTSIGMVLVTKVDVAG